MVHLSCHLSMGKVPWGTFPYHACMRLFQHTDSYFSKLGSCKRKTTRSRVIKLLQKAQVRQLTLTAQSAAITKKSAGSLTQQLPVTRPFVPRALSLAPQPIRIRQNRIRLREFTVWENNAGQFHWWRWHPCRKPHFLYQERT